ncbi:MAG: glycosyltransferase family 4 protein [Chloroflexota bacterium]
MKIGIAIEETWSFLHEIIADLKAHHTVSLFERRQVGWPVFNERINRTLFHHDLHTFMRQNDVVFFEWASGLLAAASHLPKTCGIVTRLHRYEMYQWVDQINWEAVDSIILVSEAKRREFVARFPDQTGKAIVIPEAVSLERFQSHIKPFAGDIGILCHMKPRKRVYELILAFYELLQVNDNFHLHIGGGEATGFGEYSVVVRTLVDQLALQDKITFYGHVEQPEKWYHQIDLFVANGYSEGLQVSLLESIAAGCYALSHRWDGADELLPPDQLYFTNSELVQKITAYGQQTQAEKEAQIHHLQQLLHGKCDVDQTKVQIRQLIEAAG